MGAINKSIDYINSICKYREQKLLGRERIMRMAEAENLQNAFDILCESDFGGDKLSLNFNDYERLILAEELLLCDFVKEFAPTKEIEKYCLHSYDFYNAEVIVKGEFIGQDYSSFLTVEGLFSINQLTTAIKEDNLSALPEELARAIINSKQALNDGKGGMVVGTIFLKEKTKYLDWILNSSYLREIFTAECMLINIAICLRAKRVEIASEQILPCTKISDAQIKALCEANEEVKKLFERYPFKEVVLKAVACIKAGKPLVELENYISSFGASRMIANRYLENMGTNPFVLYYLKRKNEIACARTILTGKANGLDSEQIKRRIIVS